VTLVALSATHGAAFLALRLPAGEPAERHAALVTRLATVALAAVGAATVVGLLSSRVRATARPLPVLIGLALLVGALLLARAAAARGRCGQALAGTAASMVLPVLLVGAAAYPYALPWTTGGGLAVADAAAAPQTLRLLGPVVLTLLPVLLVVQVTGWWVFRGRVDRDAPAFY